VKWAKGKGISLETHRDYITEFGELFFQQCKLLIDRNQEDNSQMGNLNPEDKKLLTEVLDHAYFCNETAEKFQGRVDILDKIKDFILNDRSLKPLVLFGGSGCGKTAIMAKMTKEVI
jgi:DNA replication protein DnaC